MLLNPSARMSGGNKRRASVRTFTPVTAFTVATYGINVPGTVYRMDDVPIPLRTAFESPHPSDYDLLVGIEKRVRELKNIQPAEV